MKKNKIITIIFYIISIIFIYFNNPLENNFISSNNILLLAFSFVMIHVFKCLRQYFLLIESEVHIKGFVKTYVKTAIPSIILPYKIGELYRAYEYGYHLKDKVKGLITVIVDKFFDAIILLCVFVPYEYKKSANLSTVTLILLVFCISLLIVYTCFNATYYYLNKHFIKKSNANHNIVVLVFLEKSKELYNYVKSMIKDRMLLLTVLTIFAWSFEWLFVFILKGSSFIEYIKAVFFGTQNAVFANYMIIGIICFILIELIFLVRKCRKKI